MARKRIPCDFCSGECWPDGVDHRNGYYIWLEIYPESGTMAFIAQANDEMGEMIEDYITVDMNYCPVCGRKCGL